MRVWRTVRGAIVAALLGLLILPGAAAAVRSAPAQPADPAVSAEGDPTAIELRATLGRLLGEHAFLLMEAMRSTASGAPDAAALEAALDDNSASLSGAIALVYGEQAGSRFGTVWDEHVRLLLDYSTATRSGDVAAQRTAEDGLDAYTDELAGVLSSLNPELHAEDEATALRLHTRHLTAFAATDYASAYGAHREAFEHMFVLGDHLALAMARQFPDRFTGGAVAFSPRSDLRMELGRLLGEHLVLAAEAMRAGVAAAPDFGAASRALDGNTTDLTAAIAGVYGVDAGDAFRGVWSEHIEAYLRFVEALGADDEAARASSLEALHAYHDRIAEFLSGANPRLDQEAVANLIRRHVQALVTQAEATAAGDPERAVAATREGYDGTFEVASALAAAIAEQFPDRFEDLRELPPTDGPAEPLPAPADPRLPLMVIGLLAAVVWVGTGARLLRRAR